MKADIMKFCEKHNIITTATELFWKAFSLYKEEEPEEFDIYFPHGETNVSLCVEKIAYELSAAQFDEEYIIVYMIISVDNDSVGWYKQVFTLDGLPFDEFFVIE